MDKIQSAQSSIASMTAPAYLTVQVGQTISAGIVCKDTNGTVITCPPISWTRGDVCCANLNSNGSITGTEVGVLTARPYDAVSGVYAGVISITVTPASVSHKYRCIGNVCTQDDINGTFTEPTCGGTCISPPLTSSCTNCDLTKNYCVLNTCIPKNYVIYGAVAFFALMLIKK